MARGRREQQVSGMEEAACTGLGLPQAPVFYPTPEEFGDPLEYISQIRHLAEPYGLCKIVPPKGWDPPFALDLQSFSFPTKLQAIHQLQERPAALNPDTFRFEYDRYLQSQGRTLHSWPRFCGEELDLCKLYNSVKRHGGYEKVMQHGKWAEVLRMVMPDDVPAAAAAPAGLYHLYERHLLEYEMYAAGLEAEEGQANAGVKRPLDSGLPQPLKRLRSKDGSALVQQCEQCHSGAHEQRLLFCDRCARAWHLYCLSPPLPALPSGAWYCRDCVASEQETFGFAQGNRHTLDSFRRMCDRFKKKWFGGRPVSYADVEEEFWQIVERGTGPVEVLYGSDLDTSIYGSGFPRESDSAPRWAKPEAWQAHARSPWNLNNFPKLDGSMLRLVNENIPGVIVPWLYVGMLFSSFCWHYEDHCFYSVNYLHWGEPKCWYSVPGSSYDAFEDVMRSTFPDLFQAQPDLLFQLVTMLNPAVLREKGVPVCTTLQEAGNFVITFPRSYHGGFNHGFNCAEAVNFAPLDWIPYGRFGVERCRLYHKPAVLSHEELLFVVAKHESSRSHWLQNDLRHITEIERRQREELWQLGLVKSSRMTPRAYQNVGKEEDPECLICRYYLHLSAVVCSCRPGKAVCLEHAGQLCECSAEKKCLLYRLSLVELEDLSGSASGAHVERKPDRRKELRREGVSFQDLAKDWASKARLATSTTPSLGEVEELLRQAEQFLWAGHEVDFLRPLENALAVKLSWAKEVAACYNAVQDRLHGGKGVKLALFKVNDLMSADPLPCIEPYASKLKAVAKNACNLQKHIEKLFTSGSLLEVRALHRLQQDVLRLPVEFPVGQNLQAALLAAQQWSERVQRHLSAGKSGHRRSDLADISQLRELQSEGLKLAVMVPEKRLLDVVVKKVESWLRHAREVLDSASPLQEAEEILLEGEGLPAKLPELSSLRKQVQEAVSWRERARSALDVAEGQKDYAAAVKILKEITISSGSLQFQVNELNMVRAKLRRCSWMEKANNVLASRSPTSVLQALLDEPDGDQDLIPQIQSRADAAKGWEARATEALRSGGPYEVFAELASDSEGVSVDLEGLSEVKNELLRADSWLQRALPVVELFRSTLQQRVCIDTLKGLVSEMEASPILLSELEFLKACLRDLEEWRCQAASIGTVVRKLLAEAGHSLETAAYKGRLDEQLLQLQQFVSRGVPRNVTLVEFEDLQTLILAVKWTSTTFALMSSSPTLEKLETQLEAGRRLPGVVEACSAFRTLEGTKNRAKTWRSKVTALVEDFEAKVSANMLEQLLRESQSLKIDCRSEVCQLEQILADHRAWQSEVKKVFDGTSTLSLSELLSLQEAGEASLVQSTDVESLDTLIANVGAWLVRCEEAVGTDHSSLRAGLLQLKESANLALAVVGQRIRHYDACVCLQRTESSDNNTVTCGKCRERYHSFCMGLTSFQQTKAPDQQHYVCPFCTAISTGAVYPKDDLTAKIYDTQRPTLASLVDLANTAKSLRCRVEEEELIEEVLDAVLSWQEWAHTFAQSVVAAKNDEQVDMQALRCALKASCTIQVRADASLQVKQAVAINAWRRRTQKLLDAPGKLCYRSMSRAVDEAVEMEVPRDDDILRTLCDRQDEASAWICRARQAIEDEGEMPQEAVTALIAQGEELPVTLTRELTALRSRSVLYCICRKPYNEARGMVGCDRCGEWYHFSCINLPEPDSNDGDSDAILREELGPGGEFFCPSCRKVGKTREHAHLLQQGKRKENVQGLGAARGKRSTRSRQRPSRQQHRRQQNEQQSSNLESRGSEEDNEGSKVRPCRRTAGQHSGFGSFVLLRSR